MKKKIGTHEKGICSIVERLTNSTTPYKNIRTETSYYHGPDIYVEPDIMVELGNRLLIFEYKSNDTNHARKKAENQLWRGDNYLQYKYNRIDTFYAYSDPVVYEKIIL